MDKVERLYFDEPNSASNAIGYAKHRSRPHDTMIRVYDDAPENMIERHGSHRRLRLKFFENFASQFP